MIYSESVTRILNEISKNKSVYVAIKNLNANKNSVTYVDAQSLSKIIGTATAEALKPYAEELSAKEISIIYSKVSDVVMTYCETATQNLNSKAKIKYKQDITNDVKSEVESMLDHLRTRINEAETFDTVRFLTEENAARSITRKVTTSHMQYTSRSHQRAGLSTKIVRDEGSGCCDYCSGLAGTYTSFDDLPDNFWSVHRGCTCVFHYSVGRTQESIRFDTDKEGKMSKVID